MSAAVDLEWQPATADVAALSPRAQSWLQAVLDLYQLDPLDGQKVLECLRVLSRVEAFESEPGREAAAALVQERRLFLTMWASLGLRRAG